VLSQHNGRHRARSDASLRAGKFTALVAVAALTVVAPSAEASSSMSDMNIAAISTVGTSRPTFLFRSTGSLVSRSDHRAGLPARNVVQVISPVPVQDGVDGLDTWERQENLRVARADATAKAARVAKAAKAKVAAAKASKAKAAAAKASKEAKKARAVAAQIEAVEAAMDVKRAKVALLARTRPGPSTVATAAAKTWAAAEVTRMGYEPDQFTCLDQLWTRESGWNPRADNPTSTAYGIPQSLPGSKMASAGADWRTNPRTQMAWGLRYIKARYVNPCRAWKHSERTNWY